MRVTFRAARVNAQLTQDKAAKALGVSKYTLLNWERGKTEPKQSDLYNLARVYKCRVNDFLLPVDPT